MSTDSLFPEFSEVPGSVPTGAEPLAVRVRPTTLDEYVGQEHAVGPGSWLREAIEGDTLSSLILYGPAGTGKTTLARIIAATTSARFVEVSAVSGTVKDLRREIEAARSSLRMGGRPTILFIDEIHRFSRSQQDALLHAVEDRDVIMIGATTENPFFEVNSALNSRSRIVELHALDDEDLARIVDNAIAHADGYDGDITLEPDARDAVVLLAAGDARSALNTLEQSILLARTQDGEKDEAGRLVITQDLVRRSSPRRALPYDKQGDMHYDIISAFIKSMRGSDPDAAVYWLARMIDAGEDPRFIARRILIFASEDVGNADPQAISVGAAAFKAAEVIGYPECRLNLAQAAIYMALAPKSNASYRAINAAMDEVKNGPLRDVPDHLRDRHRPGAEEYDRYRYPHSYPGAYVDQQYLPDGLERGAFFTPTERGWEGYRAEIGERDRD